jgi:hypothetical protein
MIKKKIKKIQIFFFNVLSFCGFYGTQMTKFHPKVVLPLVFNRMINIYEVFKHINDQKTYNLTKKCLKILFLCFSAEMDT